MTVEDHAGAAAAADAPRRRRRRRSLTPSRRKSKADAPAAPPTFLPPPTESSCRRPSSRPKLESFGLYSRILAGIDEPPPSWDPVSTPDFGSIAEGNFNFTSTSTTSREDLTQVISDDDEPEGDTEADIAERESEDEHEVMDPAPSAQSMTQVEHQVKGKRVAAARNKLAKIPKRSPKKRNSDGIVQVMKRMVQVREKEVTQEQPLQKFSITRCMDALKTLDGMTGSIKIPALDVFKIADNREIFLNLVDDKDDKDGTAMSWLLAQIAKLP